LVGWLVGWLAGWLVGWVGWLIDWLVCVRACSKTLTTCGEVEERLARELIGFEMDVENQFLQSLQNISEVTTKLLRVPQTSQL